MPFAERLHYCLVQGEELAARGTASCPWQNIVPATVALREDHWLGRPLCAGPVW